MTDETHTLKASDIKTPITIDKPESIGGAISTTFSMFASDGSRRFDLIFKDGEVRGVAHGGVVMDDAARLFLEALSRSIQPFIERESIKNSWVIRETFRPERPTYYGRRQDARLKDYVQWTVNPMRALMFVRKEDAEALIRKENWSSIDSQVVRLRDLNIDISDTGGPNDL